jgi:magnesium transporter
LSEDRRPWEILLETAESGDTAALAALIEEFEEPDRVHALGRLDAGERATVLGALPPEQAAELLEAIPEQHAAEAMEELAPADAADILEALASDDRADIVGQLDEEATEAILTAAEPEAADSLREILRYPEDSAGGLMITEYVAVPAATTARELVEHLQEQGDRYADYSVQYVYALGDRGELLGVLPLRALLLARPGQSVASLMIPDPISIPATAPAAEVFEIFERHGFLGIPVVDGAGRLVGVLLRENVDEARVDRAQADELKARGIVGGEELRSMPLLSRSGRRLAWLSVNVVLNVAAAGVIAAYQDTLAAAIALAVFLPIISDMSGCSGNQAVAVSMRELSLGVLKPTEFLRVWWQEASVGCLNGLALGALIGGVAWLWKGNLALSLVVGSALALNTVVAVSIGGTVPLLLRRFGFDPALASGPILTTVTDMCGFFLVLSFATFTLARLASG